MQINILSTLNRVLPGIIMRLNNNNNYKYDIFKIIMRWYFGKNWQRWRTTTPVLMGNTWLKWWREGVLNYFIHSKGGVCLIKLSITSNFNVITFIDSYTLLSPLNRQCLLFKLFSCPSVILLNSISIQQVI